MRWRLCLPALLLLFPVWPCVGREADGDDGRLLARAICAGQLKAVETFAALRHPDFDAPIEMDPRKSLRPLSLALTCLPSRQPQSLAGTGLAPAATAKDMLRLLLQLGANPTYQEADLGKQTPLHLLLAFPATEQAELLQLLLAYYADGDLALRDSAGQTPRELAENRASPVAKWLEKYQPTGLSDMNLRLQPFAYAAGVKSLTQLSQQEDLLAALTAGQLPVARKLLAAGVSPDLRLLEPLGEPLLHRLVQTGSQSAIELMLEFGANLRIKDFRQREVLHLAAEVATPELLRWLAAHGAEVNARDGEGETPLFAAIRAARSEQVEALLKLGADADLPNHAGRTARELAREQTGEIARLLGAD